MSTIEAHMYVVPLFSFFLRTFFLRNIAKKVACISTLSELSHSTHQTAGFSFFFVASLLNTSSAFHPFVYD
jgi:hypothetical protein